jgi:hypothetical protein
LKTFDLITLIEHTGPERRYELSLTQQRDLHGSDERSRFPPRQAAGFVFQNGRYV